LDRYRGPSDYKYIRKLVSKNKTGDVFGVTIPREIALNFVDYPVKVEQSGNCILITTSGNLYEEEGYEY
jgi:hypothetical protein